VNPPLELPIVVSFDILSPSMLLQFILFLDVAFSGSTIVTSFF